MNILEEIQHLLAPLKPELVEVTDDSHKHIHHEGSRYGGHFTVTVVSDVFVGKSRIQRQKLVYTALECLFDGKIHALSVQARIPEK